MTGSRIGELRERLDPVVAALGLELFDVELVGSGRARTLRITIDREGGVDLDAVDAATRAVSPVVDVDAALEGPYTLEVTSPGLERPLRRPEHYRRAIGATISIKARAGDGGVERVRGVLVGADDASCTVQVGSGATQQHTYDDVVQVHTVFEWGPAPKPGKAQQAVERS